MVRILCRHVLLTVIDCLWPSFGYQTKMEWSQERAKGILKYHFPTTRFDRPAKTIRRGILSQQAACVSFKFFLMLPPRINAIMSNTLRKRNIYRWYHLWSGISVQVAETSDGTEYIISSFHWINTDGLIITMLLIYLLHPPTKILFIDMWKSAVFCL